MSTPDNYASMTVQQRAHYLLAKGVVARLGIDPIALKPGYAAHVADVGGLPCGYHDTEQKAVDVGTAWLKAKAA